MQKIVADLQLQWPSEEPICYRSANIDTYINVSVAMPDIVAKFKTWYRNRGFVECFRQTSTLTVQQEIVLVVPPRYIANTPLSQYKIGHKLKTFTVDNVFAAVSPIISGENARSPPGEPVFPIQKYYTSIGNEKMKLRLEKLCSSLQTCTRSRCERGYVDDLRTL
jgi:hypothetical protein